MHRSKCLSDRRLSQKIRSLWTFREVSKLLHHSACRYPPLRNKQVHRVNSVSNTYHSCLERGATPFKAIASHQRPWRLALFSGQDRLSRTTSLHKKLSFLRHTMPWSCTPTTRRKHPKAFACPASGAMQFIVLARRWNGPCKLPIRRSAQKNARDHRAFCSQVAFRSGRRLPHLSWWACARQAPSPLHRRS